MRVTLRDVAKKLNVSHATVSRALNRPNDPLISEVTRKRVLEAALEMGYRPNAAARSLVTGKTNLISLLLWSEGNHSSYQASVAQCVETVLRNEPYDLVANLAGYKTIALAERHTISPLNVDGIIAHEAGPLVKALLGPNFARFTPIVCTGSYNWLDDVDLVGIDLREGAQESLSHLIQQGRKRIAYLVTDPNIIDRDPNEKNDPRLEVYLRLMAETGLPLRFVDCSAGRAAARAIVRDMMLSSDCPDAFYSHNDDLAIGAYRGLCDLGIKVPDDVAIVGCDGIEETQYLEVPISTIVQPMQTIFELAWQALERRIQDPRAPIQQTFIRPRFEIRESSRS